MKSYFWLAINQSSAAACPIPMPGVRASPVPQLLVGFPTQEEQRRIQRVLLTASLDDARRCVLDLRGRGDLVIQRPANPEPPGAWTTWSSG